jgi:hypothetical protein
LGTGQGKSVWRMSGSRLRAGHREVSTAATGTASKWRSAGVCSRCIADLERMGMASPVLGPRPHRGNGLELA